MYQLGEESKQFWQEQLADIESIDLSFLKLREAEVNEIREIKFSFNREILTKLDELRDRYQITPYLYSQSICAMVLYRYTSQDRFGIGYLLTIAQEKDLTSEAQIDVSIIPYDFTKITNFLDIVNQATQWFNFLEQLKADHSYLPMHDILTTANKDILNLLFTEVNGGTRSDLLSSLIFEQEVKGETINYTIRYRTDQINAYLLKEFVDCYKRLFIEVLNELIDVRDTSKLSHIKDYSLLSLQQYEQIVYQRNQTYKDYPRDKTIHQLFEEQVERTPDSIALVYEEVRLTYKQLNERANRLAHYLREIGVKEGTLVGVNLDRNLKLVVVLLAILKTGGAYLPLDPNYPEDRLRFMVDDSEIPILITQDSFIKLPWLQNSIYSIKQRGVNKVSVFSIEGIEVLVKGYSFDNLTNITTLPEGLAYVVYTSGSTGQPKGVCGTHTGIVNRLIWGFEAFPYEEKEVCCQKTSLNFVDHIAELFSPLVGGTPIVLLSDQAVKGLNINAMLEEIETYSVTRIVLVPSLLQGILSVVQEAELQRLKSLKYIFCSGEILPNSLAKKCYKLLPWVKLINIYGSSEVSADAIYYEDIEEHIDRFPINSNESNTGVPIGRPIINTTLYVLDKDLKTLPLGVIGELYVGGVGLALGYLNKPELTAERFIDNPFQTEEEKSGKSDSPNGRNARLYKTGDLVRWLPDGNIEYIGRNDFQVKIRGHRIELKEVENALSSYEGVRQGVVLAREHNLAEGESATGKYLVGYYVADSKLDETEMLKYLQSKLPEYMAPSALVHLKKLPLTINGKLDRKALPAPELTSSAGYMAPRNELEKQVCRIWAEVLGLPENKVGIQDDFFKMGGNSILAIKLVGKINNLLNANIDIARVFETRTITKLISNYMVIREDNYTIGERYEF